MFPHLMGMKEYNHLSSEEMGAIIGTSRQTYEYKARCGNFTPVECKAFCKRFGKSFEYLFATPDEIDEIDTAKAFLIGLNPVKSGATGADIKEDESASAKESADDA